MKMISIVVPCYNEEGATPIFHETIVPILEKMPVSWELIFVDDGSKDHTLQAFRVLAQKDERVKYVSFSRNFGKESAMIAGLDAAKGDYIAIMDVDLQDPPHLIPEMFDILETTEYDCVATRRVTRTGEPPLRSFFARMFYRGINCISKTEIVDGARDFRLMTRQMVNAILEMREVSRFSKGIFSWVGFQTKWLEYENIERSTGETKWNFWSLLVYSIDGMIGFSTAPLAFASVIGVIFCLIALGLAGFFLFKTLFFGDPVAGFPATICIVLLLGGVQLFCMGILGQYLAKTYLETKQRPLYIVKESNAKEE